MIFDASVHRAAQRSSTAASWAATPGVRLRRPLLISDSSAWDIPASAARALRPQMGALLSSQEWKGFKSVGKLAGHIQARLSVHFDTTDVLMTYEQELHILERRDSGKVAYVAGNVIRSIPQMLGGPEYFGIQKVESNRVDFAVASYLSEIDRYALLGIKALKGERTASHRDELLITTGWEGGEDGLAEWIVTRSLGKL